MGLHEAFMRTNLALKINPQISCVLLHKHNVISTQVCSLFDQRLNACAYNVLPDYPVQSAQTNQRRHFLPKLDFAKKRQPFNKNIP